MHHLSSYGALILSYGYNPFTSKMCNYLEIKYSNLYFDEVIEIRDAFDFVPLFKNFEFPEGEFDLFLRKPRYNVNMKIWLQ